MLAFIRRLFRLPAKKRHGILTYVFSYEDGRIGISHKFVTSTWPLPSSKVVDFVDQLKAELGFKEIVVTNITWLS